MSNLERFCRGIRSSSPYRSLIPLEASLSYPVPHKSPDGDVYLDFLVYTVERAGKDESALLHKPFASLRVTYPDGEWVGFHRHDHMYHGWQDQVVAEYPSLSERGLTFSESKEQRRRLYAAIEKLIPSLLIAEVSKNGVQDSVDECWKLWLSASEPGLLDEYRSINPEYFEWLETNAEAE